MKSLVAMLLALSTTFAFAQTYKIDPASTQIKWVGKKITGQHDGNINVKNGTLKFDGDLITSGDVVVDMKTISVNDIPKDNEANAKLVGHLSSADFFDVSKHPESKLVITGSEKTAKGLKVKGNLTMLGKTNPVEFLAKVNKTDKTATAESEVVLDRTKWGLKYGSSSFFKSLGDKAIHNDFTLSVKLSAKK